MLFSKKNIFGFLLFFQLCIGYAQNSNTIKAEYFSKKGIDRVTFYENLNLNQKRAYRDFFYQNFPKLSSEEEIKSSKKSLMRFKFALAEVYNVKEDELKSIEILKEIQNDKDYKLSDKEHMDLLVGLQKSYLNLNLYSNAFKVNSEISKLRKKGLYTPLWSYNSESTLYASLFLYDKAIIQLKREIKELLKNPKRDSLIVPSAYNNLGFYFSMNNQIDSAFHYYNYSLKLSETSLKKNNPEAYANLSGIVKGNLGFLHVKLKDYKAAIPLLKEDAAAGLKDNYDINGALKSILLLSECHSHLKDYPEAEKAMVEAEKLLRKNIVPLTKVSYYKTKAELLKSLNKTEEAYEFYEKAFHLNDSINKEEQRQLLAGNEIMYHLEEKNAIIEQQKLDLSNKQRNTLLLLLSALSVFLITSFYYLNNSKKKRRKIQQMNIDISNKNKVIQESLSEKEMLLKEIHHRVKNNLQIISGILELQNLNISDENAKIILKEGQARIQSIALIHKTLYQSDSFSKVHFQNYLTELIQAIQATYRNTHTKIDTVINANDIELSINTAIPLSLIINEIVTNCFKHAFTGRETGTISIRLTKENDYYNLSVLDDGNGLPSDFNPKKLHSIGFDLIQGLSKQLEGNFGWKNENGTNITITFKDTV
jgi:two-component sensor histidine kinase